jgi:hypothetical protein
LAGTNLLEEDNPAAAVAPIGVAINVRCESPLQRAADGVFSLRRGGDPFD